jgi:hypothetical protein
VTISNLSLLFWGNQKPLRQNRELKVVVVVVVVVVAMIVVELGKCCFVKKVKN